MFEPILKAAAKKVPPAIRKTILEEKWIDKVVNVGDPNTPMEVLFDVYNDKLDATGELNDFHCHQCRQKIIEYWRSLKPHLEELEEFGMYISKDREDAA